MPEAHPTVDDAAPSPRNPSTALARVLVDELIRCGVRDAVLSPGSRSAPLAYALADAEAAGRIRVHVRVDERTAGFWALGLAKVSRRPAVVVCTSGTALANLHPAVLEAAHAHVPMILLTADRPPELWGTGANQTTTQPGIFAGAPVWSTTLGVPERRAGQVGSWRATACRAWTAAVGGDPYAAGPVHIDVPLRDPLTPDQVEPGAQDDPWPEPLDGRPDGAPWVSVEQVPFAAAHAPSLVQARRTVLLLGDLPDVGMAEPALRLAQRQGWPVVAEPFGVGDRSAVLPSGDVLLGTDFPQHYPPERVLVVGRITTSRAFARLMSLPGVRVEAVGPSPNWTDPSARIAAVHPWTSLLPAAEVDAEPLEGPEDAGKREADEAWARRWRDAAGSVGVAVRGEVAGSLTGPGIAAAVLDRLDARDVLVLAASRAVRDVMAVSDPGRGGQRSASVVGHRGLAGIDGTISSALGIAAARDEEPGHTRLLIGDLAFLHDAGALLSGPHESLPDLAIVLVNDAGGTIFAGLEHGTAATPDVLSRYFLTPTSADVGRLCAGYGILHRRVEDSGALDEALTWADGGGVRVVEVTVDPEAAATTMRAALSAAAGAIG